MNKSTLAIAVAVGLLAQQASAAGFIEDSKATLKLPPAAAAAPEAAVLPAAELLEEPPQAVSRAEAPATART